MNDLKPTGLRSQHTTPIRVTSVFRTWHRRNALRVIAAFSGLLMLGTTECLPSLIRFNFTGDDPGLTLNWSKTSTLDPHVTTTGFSRGGGLTGWGGDNRYNAKGWTIAPYLAMAQGENDYFGFTLTPESGYALNLNSAAAAFTLCTSSAGPSRFALMSSIDGFSMTSAPLLSEAVSDTMNFVYTFPSTGFDLISSAIEFRLYGWGAGSSSGTMSMNAFDLGGSVTPVPEPAAWGVLSGVFLLGVLALHSMRKRT